MKNAGRVIVAGSINMDLVAAVPRLPRPGETVRGGELTFHPGGKGANQAVAAARAGAAVTMYGCLGQDPYAAELEAFLRSNGVDVAAVRRDPSAVTGVALVLVDAGGQNTIVSIPGANARLRPEALASLDARPHDVLIAQFETPLDTTEAFFAAGRAGGATTVLNAAPAEAGPLDLLALTDVLVVNEAELALCCGDRVEGSAGILDASRHLQSRGARVVVVTLGAQGVVAADQHSLHQVPGRTVPVVDTTGAGDCFVGNLAARLAAGDALAACLAYANAAASVCVQRPGAGPSMPRADEVPDPAGG